MGTTLTESESFDLSIVSPTPGTLGDANEIKDAQQKFANRDRYLIERLPSVHYTATAGGNWVRVPLAPVSLNTAHWTLDQKTTAEALGWKQTNTSAEPIFFWLHVPVTKGVLKGVHAQVFIDTGHAGVNLTPPRITLYKNDWENNTITSLGNASCNNSSLPVYEQLNPALLQGLSESFTDPEPGGSGAPDYLVRFEGESGTDALVNKVYLIGLQAHIAQS